jgi:stage V sporulation protein D (sporulation-specific penicillin-binding protein)
VTVVQMASALGAIANDGVLVPPRVVLGTRDAGGWLQPAPPAAKHRALERQTADLVRQMMEHVVAEGTGKRAAVPGYRIAGKSGTAQKAISGGYSATDYMASFGGFGPADEPRIVALVVLDSPRGEWTHGGQVAAPVFAAIMGEALRHLRAPYDDPPAPAERKSPDESLLVTATTRGRALAHPVTPGVMPDLIGLALREALPRLVAAGCRPDARGSGVVLDQQPPAGAALPPGDSCRLVLGPPAQLAAERALQDAAAATGTLPGAAP